LTKSLAYLNPTQRAALRNTSRVALNNAEALRDLIDYCYSNIYNGDCASFIAKHCPYDSRIDDRSRSCIREYSTKLFDLTNHDELELTLQQYNRLVAPSKSENIGMDLLQMPGVEVFSARNKTRRSITLDKSSGEVMGLGGLEIYSPKSNSKITTSFLIKTKTKLERAKLWPIDSTGSFQVSVYQGEGWKVCQDQDSNNQYDRDVMDGAIAVNGYYYYKYDIKDMETLRMYMDIFKKEDIEITFYRKSTHVTPMTTGLSSDNKPFYFTARNIEVTKDINNNDIGYCLADNNINLMRTTDTGYCKTYGRLYTWDDAIKACEAYSEHHEASTGLFFRLPSNDDYDLYFDRVEQESGVDKVAYWLKSYQFEKHNNQYQTINKLGFNAQAGGRFKSHNNGSYSSSPKGTEGTLWGATEENGSANLVSFDSADKFVTKTFVDKSNLSPVRCIGSFTR
ncbi:MAG: fibrobacter succinogenes major paralogous domain-containing protein, partial [Kangiellaceae bacterium]|nr:fibrobacter succinogenes major paralogous domain-containing protein [Kangiellaceae bacterium]